MGFALALPWVDGAFSVLDFQSGSRAVLRVAPLGVSCHALLQSDLLVNENIVLLSFYVIHKVVMIWGNIGLCFEGPFNLLALYQTINNFLKTLLALDHRFDNNLLVLAMILLDVVLQWFCATAWHLNLNNVVLLVSSLTDLMIQVDFAGANQILLSSNVDHRDCHIILLHKLHDFGI